MAHDAAKDAALADALLAGDRRALGRAITLVESTRKDHRARAERLLSRLIERAGHSVRLGISGAPGVGKSTFIEAFGLHLIEAGHRVAVLAVDPSSARSGGSILGDKTRMPELSRDTAAFIRPSPAGVTLGGVARRTREAVLLVEAAGYDVVLVETVGVGQSETAVADMVDMFLLLLAPGAGDELQGIKRGIMELADLVIVNKADGALADAARHAVSDYRSALSLLRPKTPHWRAEVQPISALQGDGIADVWDAVARFRTAMAAGDAAAPRRAAQMARWMWREVEEGLLESLKADAAVATLARQLEAAVREGQLMPALAARRLLNVYAGKAGDPE